VGIDLDTSLPAELGPLSWLKGTWEGTGVLDYRLDDDTVHSAEFGQRVVFTNDGLPWFNYSSFAWLLDDERTPLIAETGYWRLGRAQQAFDAGPGMVPPTEPSPYVGVESVEPLRNQRDGFDLEVAIVHPTGVNELYMGQVKGPRIDLATDAVVRTEGAKEYRAATRIYGLVESDLLWAWDMAALGKDLRNHASGRLARVS
jgi:hypothetical protein